MKKLILLLILLPSILFAQNSWINIQLLTDDYPVETSWTITPPGGFPIIAQNNSGMTGQTLYDTIIDLGGTIIVNLYDQYGDGLGGFNGSPEGWFLIQNDCQDTIMYVAGNFGSLYTDTLIIAPCAPPISGCTNPIAINFDPLAVIDDGSCQFIQGCMNPNAANYDSTAGELPNGLIVSGGSCNLTSWNQNYFGIDSTDYWNNPSLWSAGARIYISGQQWFVDGVNFPTNCNAPAVLIYVVPTEAQADGNTGTFVPGLNVNAVVGEDWLVDPCIFIYGCTQPNALNYNPLAGVDDGSCINIPGCMDSTSANYNPAATLDDGSCGGGGPIACSPGKELLTVQIMLDQYASETGWDIYTTGGTLIHEQPIGSYSGQPMGAIVTKYICIDYGTEIQFTIDDDFGDGLGGAQFGGIDGMWIVYTECDTISMGIGDFGYSYSDVGFVNECVQTPIPGCTDPSYQEFNPMATVDDSSCTTLNVFGCIDTNAFNYDPNATAQLQNPGCVNTLRLTDWAGNGWAGSFLVVTQGNNWWGPFTLGANDLVLDTAIYFNTQEEIKTYFYSFGQSVPTSNQCMFQIINPIGFVVSEGGTNSFTDPLLSYNQYGQIYDDIALCGDNCIPKIYGCTDPLAVNYVPPANTTDNSCYYNPGCTDAAYLEYHNQGFVADYDDGSYCLNYAIFGCMDSTQFNYDQYATVQWTSVVDQTDPCIAKVFGCLDPTAFNFDPLANTEDYSCVPFIYGCMDMTMWNYDPTANTDNASCIPFEYGCTDTTALNYNPLANTDNGTCIPYLYGCTDSLALNYNSLANTDDGGCILTVLGCTSPIAFNYDSSANTDDGSCIPFIYGCMDNTQFNFDPLANTSDNSCIPIINGCTDPTQFNYNPLANTDNGSCIPFIYGCTDPLAFNYNALANTNNGSCDPIISGCIDSTALNYNPLANTSDGSCITILLGCTDSTALNYNVLANVDDGSCIDVVYGCTDINSFNYSLLANVDDGSCIPYIYGCTDPTQFNYNANANTDDSTCIPYLYGCMDATAFNYDPLANTDNGSCILVIFGCTDSTALNYNILANTDNGTCILPITGCTDVGAWNYDPLANTSDSTACLYDAGCYGGPGNPYWLNDGCFAWVIDVDDYCCTNDWDASCQSMYDYCQLGWPTSVEDISSMGIMVYPNPTGDIINIDTRLEVEVEIYDLTGRKIISEKSKRISLSGLPNGVYNLILIYNNKRFTTRVIKQ